MERGLSLLSDHLVQELSAVACALPCRCLRAFGFRPLDQSHISASNKVLDKGSSYLSSISICSLTGCSSDFLLFLPGDHCAPLEEIVFLGKWFLLMVVILVLVMIFCFACIPLPNGEITMGLADAALWGPK